MTPIRLPRHMEKEILGRLGMKPPKRRSKYHNRRVQVDGEWYDSAAEARYGAELKLLLRAGEIARIDRQLSFDIVVNGTQVCRYFADFVLTYPDGRVEAVEVKGYETPVWVLKRKLMAACYPDIAVRVVKV